MSLPLTGLPEPVSTPKMRREILKLCLGGDALSTLLEMVQIYHFRIAKVVVVGSYRLYGLQRLLMLFLGESVDIGSKSRRIQTVLRVSSMTGSMHRII